MYGGNSLLKLYRKFEEPRSNTHTIRAKCGKGAKLYRVQDLGAADRRTPPESWTTVRL